MRWTAGATQSNQEKRLTLGAARSDTGSASTEPSSATATAYPRSASGSASRAATAATAPAAAPAAGSKPPAALPPRYAGRGGAGNLAHDGEVRASRERDEARAQAETERRIRESVERGVEGALARPGRAVLKPEGPFQAKPK
jgi:hypothetical protein